MFSVTRSGITTGSNSVSWAVTGALPASVNPVDFVGGVVPSGTVSFAPGELVKNVTVDIAGDTALEPDEWFKVLLLLPTNGAVISNGVALGKVVNDETSMSIAATDAVKAEGDSGSTSFTFTVTRGGNTGGTHTVHWQVTGLNPNTAGAADFAGGAAPSGTLTFALAGRAAVIAWEGDPAAAMALRGAARRVGLEGRITIGIRDLVRQPLQAKLQALEAENRALKTQQSSAEVTLIL